MLEMIVFAITLVVSNVIAGFTMLKLMTTERFIKAYAKLVTRLTDAVTENFNDKEDKF